MMAGDPYPYGVPTSVADEPTSGYCMCPMCTAQRTAFTGHLYNVSWEPYGWICPKCGAVMAPSVMECRHCNHSEAVFPVNIADLPRLEPSITAEEACEDYVDPEEFGP